MIGATIMCNSALLIKLNQMKNIAALYEKIIFFAWKKVITPTDKLELLSCTIAANTGHHQAGQNSAKYGLSMALKTVAGKNKIDTGLYTSLVELDRRVWKSKNFEELAVIIQQTDETFEMITSSSDAMIPVEKV